MIRAAMRAIIATSQAARVTADQFGHSPISGTVPLLTCLSSYLSTAANREIVDTIGVAPDIYVPLTSADLSAGRDLALAKAQELLR